MAGSMVGLVWGRECGRPLRELVLVGGLLLAGGVGARGQAPVAVGSRARICRVPTIGEASRFRVPQVQLPNVAVARRINRQLLRFSIAPEFTTVDSAASPRRQLVQAARECCYEEDMKIWLAAGNSLTGITYEVLLNQDYLLSFQFQYDYGSLAEPKTHHLTFDLHTGRVLTLPDLVADSPAQPNRRLGAAISRRLRDNLADVAAEYGDSAIIDRVARLYGLETWDTTPSRGLALDTGGPVETAAGNRIPLEFALQPGALLLFHPVGMMRLDLEFLPDETYIFPFGRLHPRGLLVPVARRVGHRK